MPKRTHRRLTDAEHDARRQADRARIEQSARALLTSDGWQRWIGVRATNGLSRYSVVILRTAVIDRVEWARGRRRHVIDRGLVRT
jgi:hypothetical protein